MTLMNAFNLHKDEQPGLNRSQSRRQNTTPIDLRKRPIAELHVHVDGGTINADTLAALAQSNGLPIPENLIDENKNIRYSGSFLDFLAKYTVVANFIKKPADVERVVYDYLKRCHEEGAIYVELTCSPDHVKSNDKLFSTSSSSTSSPADTLLNYPAFVQALAAGIEKARKEFGIEARLLMVLLRHNGTEAAKKVVQDVIANPHPYVTGINLAGDESGNILDFAECYQMAKEANLYRTAHVGEHTGAENIMVAVNALDLQRVGHGITAAQSPTVMDALKQRGTVLEVCPSSNVHLNVVPNYASHPLKVLMDAGVRVTVNSDDPTFFECSLGQEHERVKTQWNFSETDMLGFTKTAIDASFTELTLRAKLRAHVDLYEKFQALKAGCGALPGAAQQSLDNFEANARPSNLYPLLRALEMHSSGSDLDIQQLCSNLQASVEAYDTIDSAHSDALQAWQSSDRHANTAKRATM